MATNKLGDITLTRQTGTTLTINTENKYVDKNLAFGLAVQGATTSSHTASADIVKDSTDSSSLGGVNIYNSLGTKQTTEPSNGYYIRLKAIGSGNSQITEAGWLETGSLPAASTTASYFFPVTGSTVTQNLPTIDSSTGIVSATASVTAGYTTALTTSPKTLQLSTQSATTYTPGTTNQTIGAGVYLTGTQTIKGDSNLAYQNIKSGVTIFGKLGTFTNANTVASGQTAATTATILPGYSAWVNGQEVQGNITLKPAHTYTPGTTNQIIAPDVYLSGPQTILGDPNLISENIRNGVFVFGIEGSCVQGSAVNVVETLDVHGGTIVTITSTNEVYGTAEEVGF